MASDETLRLTRAECSSFQELATNVYATNDWLENVNINEYRRRSANLVASLWKDIPQVLSTIEFLIAHWLTKLYRQGRLAADRPDYAESDGHDTATTSDAEPDEEEKLKVEKTILIDDEDAEEDESTGDFEVDNEDSDDASITGSEMSGEAMEIEEDVRSLFDTSTTNPNLMST